VSARVKQARAVAGALLAACSPVGDPGPTLVSAAFRCWTPYRDWEHGEAGLRTLRQVVAGFGSHAAHDGEMRPQAVITDGETVVVDAATAPPPGQPLMSMTLVLTLTAGLVEEAKVYVDPRALTLVQ
jgi:hypothetical protein